MLFLKVMSQITYDTTKTVFDPFMSLTPSAVSPTQQVLKHTGERVCENARTSHTGKEADMCRASVCLLASASHLIPMTSHIKWIVASMCYIQEDQVCDHTAHKGKLGFKSKFPAVLNHAAQDL